MNRAPNDPSRRTLEITSAVRRQPSSGQSRRPVPLRRVRAAAALAGVVLVLAAAAQSATITVNSALNSNDPDDGQCTLREAITSSNTNAASGAAPGECAGGDPGDPNAIDVIVFQVPDPNGVYDPNGPAVTILASSFPSVTQPVLIDGLSQMALSECPPWPPRIGIHLHSNSGGTGLPLVASHTTVRGLAMDGYSTHISMGAGTDRRIQCNFIGTDASGLARTGPLGTGIAPAGSSAILGTDGDGDNDENEGNLISPGGIGVHLQQPSPGLRISGNRIGPDAAGGLTLGNTQGVNMASTVNDILIGSDGDGVSDELEGNVIAGNSVVGVGPQELAGTGLAIRRNSIHSNGGLGIDLRTPGGVGVTENDPFDTDTGPNDLQNFPDIDVAATAGSSITISGTLHSRAGLTYTLEFFSSPVGDPSGNGEGQTYLGSTVVVTDGAGNAPFSPTLAVSVPVGHVITATATEELAPGDPNDWRGNTSEFSDAVTVVTSAFLTSVSPEPDPVDEGTAVTVTAVFEDDPNDTPHTATVDWGDGSPLETMPAIVEPNSPGSIMASHVYADDGLYDVEVCVTDNDPGATDCSTYAGLEVQNVAPFLTIDDPAGSPALLNDGETLMVSASFQDPGFTPSDPNQAGSETFTYTIDWGDGTVDPNEAPVPGGNITPGDANGPTTGFFTGSHGYAAPGDYTVLVTVTDDDGGPDTESFSVHVNALPVASDDQYCFDPTSDPNETLMVPAPGVLENDTDPDSGPSALSATVVSPPDPNATADFALNADGSFRYTPAPGFRGGVSFVYEASDGMATATATVDIEVDAFPVAVDDVVETEADTPIVIDVLANDFDPDPNEAFGIVAFDPNTPQGGTISYDPNEMTLTYTPPAGLTAGVDTFTYTIRDENPSPVEGCGESTATVTVYIHAADIGVVKTLPAELNPGLDEDGELHRGTELTYRVTVTNHDDPNDLPLLLPTTANVEFEDVLNFGNNTVRFVEVDFPGATDCQTQDGGPNEAARKARLTCSIVGLAPQQSVTGTYTVDVGLGHGTVGNGASVQSAPAPDGHFDPDQANNTASTSTRVQRIVDLELEKTAEPDPVSVGQTVTYTLSVTNLCAFDPNSPCQDSAASPTDIFVLDCLPQGLEFVPEQSPDCELADPNEFDPPLLDCATGTLVSCGVGTVTAGDTHSVTLVAQAMGAGPFTNLARAESLKRREADAGNNSDTAVTNEPTATPTATPAPPTATETPVPPTATETPMVLPTSTPTVQLPTATPLPATATAVASATATGTLAASATPGLPAEATATPTLTSGPAATATSTTAAATATATPTPPAGAVVGARGWPGSAGLLLGVLAVLLAARARAARLAGRRTR